MLRSPCAEEADEFELLWVGCADGGWVVRAREERRGDIVGTVLQFVYSCSSDMKISLKLTHQA